MNNTIKNIIPDWVKSEDVMGEGKVTVDGAIYQYHILCKEKEPGLPGFVGFAEAEFLFISAEVPEEYRKYILGHEVHEFVRFKDSPNSCLESLIVELSMVPENIFAAYVKYRCEFFKRLVAYAMAKKYSFDFQARIQRSLEYLKNIPS